jgi:ribosomal protein L37E
MKCPDSHTSLYGPPPRKHLEKCPECGEWEYDEYHEECYACGLGEHEATVARIELVGEGR